MVDTESPSWDGEEEAETERPGEGQSNEVEHFDEPSEEKGLPADTTFSLVSVDGNGAWGEDGNQKDEPWGLGGAVDELVEFLLHTLI